MDSNTIDYEALLKHAFRAKEYAYAPYSGFKVGAALITAGGRVYTGANIENASYGATCCAERTAVFSAVSCGDRKIAAIAIASDSENTIFPCGICRQVLTEFGDGEMDIVCGKRNGEYTVYKLHELIPQAFELT
ncbi:cytidine deaminase [Anaerobacterium chartisolvens]|uniref:Cytidine deaminase n=1 Tax=Anaerobacterium chartisolvens TaxID=1297424 RepID=A0A369B084_9FIRM|nr:cytidine deaminase [Anaerobacterium chartisolvens]RCX13846.1 cytidine deaminase [Anaerobacterium chartisolvens]